MKFRIKINAIALTFLAICICSLTATSQIVTKQFRYQKIGKSKTISYHLGCDGDSVQIAYSVLKEPKIYSRSITSTNGDFVFLVNKKEKKAYLNDSNGNSLFTVPMSGRKNLEITLADGTQYSWRKNGGRGWKYVSGSKEIITCSFISQDGKKYLKYYVHDASVPGMSEVLMMCHIYGVDLIQAKAQEPVWIFSGIALGVISVLASSSSPPAQ